MTPMPDTQGQSLQKTNTYNCPARAARPIIPCGKWCKCTNISIIYNQSGMTPMPDTQGQRLAKINTYNCPARAARPTSMRKWRKCTNISIIIINKVWRQCWHSGPKACNNKYVPNCPARCSEAYLPCGNGVNVQLLVSLKSIRYDANAWHSGAKGLQKQIHIIVLREQRGLPPMRKWCIIVQILVSLEPFRYDANAWHSGPKACKNKYI